MSSSLFKIKSFRGGLSDWNDTGVVGSFKFGSNLDIHRDTDSLTCNQALADDLATGTLAGLPLWIVPCSNGNSYLGCEGGYIYKRTSAGVYSLVYTDAGGTITGMTEWGNDNGDTFLYWATATKLHRMIVAGNWGSDIDKTVNGQAYPKSDLTSATWHTMKPINGSLLILNADKIAQVGYDDSYINEIVSLTPGTLGKCLMEYNSYAYIGDTKSGGLSNSEMFVWDTYSSNWNGKNTTPTTAINAMVNAEYPLMQVGTSGQVLLADISKYTMPIVAFPGGGSVNPDGVEVDGGLALFGSYGNGTGKTGIYSYGRKKKNADPVLNLEYAFDCAEIGSVKKVGSVILMAYEKTGGSAWGVKKVSTTLKATGTYQSIDLLFPTSDREPVLTKIRIITASLPTNATIACYRRMDKTGDFVQCNLEGGGTTFSTVGGREAWFLVGDKGKIAELELVLTPSANTCPEVYEVQLYFE
jgi:hypothetical protein